MARNNYQQANIEIMEVLQKYNITSALILLGSQTDWDGHIHGNIIDIVNTLRRASELGQVHAFECRQFINQVNQIKLWKKDPFLKSI